MKTKLTEQLSSLLPNRANAAEDLSNMGPEAINAKAEALLKHQTAQELARIKYKERRRLKTLEQHKEEAEAAGLSDTDLARVQTKRQIEILQEQKKRVEAIEAIEAQTVDPLDVESLSHLPAKQKYTSNTQSALKMQGASRAEITRLLNSLNINLSVQLTKQDTANLLACLLTCNEAQLAALYNNKKIPIAIKTIIKRLQEDANLGNIETIEKLWDRVFGKNQMSQSSEELEAGQSGLIPNVPVSREAFVIIRDTILS